MTAPRGDRLRLQDILDAIAEVQNYLPADRTAFDSNPLLQSHIFRYVMIVGEAAFRLSKAIKAANPHIQWAQIEGMRHILVHDYFRVNWARVYDTARKDVPALRPLIEAMLASLPPDSNPQI
jgi:uncharacterized protein with HEPN domain